MKTFQRLEVIAGIATFMATLLFIYFIEYPLYEKSFKQYNDPSGYNWFKTFLVVILPSLLVALGSYFHAFRKSMIGLGIILLPGGFLTFLFALFFLSGSAFEGHLLIGISSGFFALVTIIFAVVNTLLCSVEYKDFPQT